MGQTLLVNQSLNIAAIGIVEGGYFSYSYDDQGKVNWAVQVTAGYLFFSKTLQYHGVVQIDPKYLVSANMQAGESMKFGNLTLTVDQVDAANQQATGTLSYQDAQGNQEAGQIVFDLSETNVKISSVNLNGKIQGQSVQIQAS